MPLTVRPATAEDAAVIAAIYNQAVVGTTATFDTIVQTPEARARWLERHGARHPVVVAVDEGRVVGWGALSAWSDRPAYDATSEISIYVDETSHGRGIGGLLGVELLERARGAGMRHIVSRVCAENAASLKLSERLGFTVVGVSHDMGRKFGRWLDVVMLEKLL